ncbi:TetR/AcrR family transcriptional regulator [Croceibacterium sp. TMG7-5b_MA50]|uniref:TetR/AcrR family transcriptional regulator n=1 Tax=Croceibacterium sp. TMG7-5b_MA50 TaxID=3121290 RepID=UPI00322185F4
MTDERLDRRREGLIQAAEQLFLEQGVERTALADVVKRGGGSLATLYKLFGGKAGLLEAVMQARVAQSGVRMVAFAATAPSPREVLLRLARDLRRRADDPAEVALSRVLIASSIEDPAFASRFYGKTFVDARAHLERLFVRWQEDGHALTAEPSLLAAMFLGMFVFELQSQAISHGCIAEGDEQCLEQKVSFFCHAAGLD